MLGYFILANVCKVASLRTSVIVFLWYWYQNSRHISTVSNFRTVPSHNALRSYRTWASDKPLGSHVKRSCSSFITLSCFNELVKILRSLGEVMERKKHYFEATFYFEIQFVPTF